MIKYLQNLRNKKGFTLVELIIVVAIIAVLAAMVIPMFNNDDAQRRVVNTYASDFFTGLQFNFTRYQKTEADISPAIAAEIAADIAAGKTPFMKYDPTVGQNILGMPFIYIEAHYDNELKYVHVNVNLEELLKDTTTTSNTALEQQIHNDMANLINKAGNGYYYAVVTMNANYNNLKVITTHFTDERLPEFTGDVANYKKDVLMFIDESELANGFYCGTCTGDNTSGAYVGNIGTYFFNVSDPGNNNLWA